MAISFTTALTILGSFGAASTAQIVSHILTQKREDKKNKKECLQNLYSPSVLLLIDLIQYEGYHHCSEPTIRSKFNDKEILIVQVLDNMGQNLKFADADLINCYQTLRNSFNRNDPKEALDDPTNLYIWDSVIELTEIFFAHFIKINKSLKSDSNSIMNKIEAPYFFCQFYLLFNDCFARYKDNNTHSMIFSFYDLIEFILFPINNYTERILKIRKELEIVYSNKYKDNQRGIEAFIDAHQFFYEIADEFSIASLERATNFKTTIDKYIN